MKSKAGLIAILWALLASSFAPADTKPEIVTLEDFKKDLPKVAQKVLDIVEGEKQPVVAVGQFRGPAQHEANFGPGIADLLSQALEAEKPGVVVKQGAELSVQGSYAFVDEPTDRTRVLVKLRIEVINRQFERVKEFVAELKNNSDIARILGLTVSLSTDPDDPKFQKPERNREIKLRLGDPKVTVDGSRIRATPESKLAVEIRVKGEKKLARASRDAKVVGGQAFVDIQHGEVYQVVIHNGGKREVGVALTIDGLDAFTFSEVLDRKTKKRKYTHYVIDAGKSATIVGWHLRDQPPDNYSSFLVTEYGKGASSRAGIASSKEDKIGVLTVAFSLAFPAGEGARGTSETGFGPPLSVKVEPVQRDFEQPHEFVTVRYAR